MKVTQIHPAPFLTGSKRRLAPIWAPTLGRRALPVLVFAAAYVATYRYQTTLPLPAAFYPPGALLLASFLLLPPRRWWPYLIVATIVQIWVFWSFRIPAPVGVAIWIANIAEPLVIVYLLRRFASFASFDSLSLRFTNMRTMALYAACALVGVGVSASLAALGLGTSGRPYWPSWGAWFLSDYLTDLVLAPAIVLWALAGFGGLQAGSRRRAIEATVVYGGLLLIGIVVFGSRIQGQEVALAPVLIYLPVPLLLWAATRFGLRGALTALSLICLLGITGVARRVGPFISLSTHDSVLTLQVFLFVIGVPLVVLATLVEERARALMAQEAIMQERTQALAKAQASDRRYRAFFDLNAVGAAQADPYDGRLLHVNETFCHITGYTREALLGMRFTALTHPEDREANFDEYQALSRGDTSAFSTQKRYIRADGQTIWVQVDATMLRDDMGKPIHSLAIIQDITERKRAEEALRASEVRYRAAFESAATGMMLVGLDGHSLRVNRPLVEMLGYSEEELRTHTFEDFTYPDDLDANVDLLRQAKAGEIDTYQLEKRFIHKEGRLVWGLVSAGLVRNDAGQPLYFVGQVQDITERKRAEEELRASEERFRAMADTAPVLIWVAGPDGLMTFLNAPWLRFTGRDLAQELGNGWAEGVHRDDRSSCLSAYLAALHARRDFTIEYRLRRYDGEYRWLVDSGVPRFSPDGSFLGYIGSAVDITEHKQAEEQLNRLSAQLMLAQDEERRRIARELHDSTVQTVMAVKLNLASLRRQLGDKRSGGDRFTRVLDENEALMEQAATELRTLSYLLHPPLLDEVGLVAALAWYVEGFARRSGLAIGLEAPDDLERLPTDIETPLYRVVQEALSNVHRHSGSKSARIVLSKRANAVWLRIQDRGKGMTGAIAGGEGVGIINGSVAPSELGVGIAGMRQRLRQIGGRLEIRSTARGTTITAVVPLARNTGHSGVSGSEHSASEAGTA